MVTTPVSLLKRLQTGHETGSWDRFVRVYTPLLFRWVRRAGIEQQEAADIVQDVFSILVRKLPSWEYDEKSSFSRWLHTVTANRCRDHFRRRAARPERTNQEVVAGDVDNVALYSQSEYRQALARRALELMQEEFQPATWQACWESVVSGRPAAEIAAELGVSRNAVYVSKSRVLRRLREELDGLWE